GAGRLGLGVELLLLVAQGPALVSEARRPGLVARPLGLAHLLRQGLHPGPGLVTPAGQLALTLVEGGGPVELRRVDAAAGQARLESIELGPEPPRVEHGRTVACRCGGPREREIFRLFRAASAAAATPI